MAYCDFVPGLKTVLFPSFYQDNNIEWQPALHVPVAAAACNLNVFGEGESSSRCLTIIKASSR